MQGLIERGRATGEFRADLPLAWLVSLAMNVMHAAAAEVSARLAADEAPSVIAGTLLAALTAPGAVVPPLPA